MWPWEHLAVGYLLYSAFVRYYRRRLPAAGPVIVLCVATQLADLIDKPLAWSLDVLPTARSLAHSLLFVVPSVAAVVVLTRRRGVPAVGDALAVGYTAHLLGDVLYPVLRGGGVYAAYLYWPLGDQPVRETPGLDERTLNLLGEFLTYLSSPSGWVYLGLELALLGGVLALWTVDGRPGLRVFQ